MEDYVAADQRPLAKCLEDVATCDLYVGIFAHRYGHVSNHDNPERRSITELEYRHAEALGIPLLVFLLEELGRERLVSFFATADELARQVSVAVTRELARLSASQQTYQLLGGLPAVQAGRRGDRGGLRIRPSGPRGGRWRGSGTGRARPAGGRTRRSPLGRCAGFLTPHAALPGSLAGLSIQSRYPCGDAAQA
jgi:Domain of unknown function (DUF4062)